MEQRHLGNSGLTLSVLGIGCNNFGMKIDSDAASAVVNQALDEGITHFDTAESYGGGRSEEMLGAALGTRRSEVIIATKFGSPGTKGTAGGRGSRRNVVRAVEGSLQRLGTDYIDLYYLHRPDRHTPIDETLDALSDLVYQGKVRYIGSSVMPGWQMADAEHTSRVGRYQRFVATQIEWSLLSRDVETEVVPAARHYGVGVVPFFPLASGLLTGKYKRGEAFPDGSRFAAIPALAGYASEENFDLVEKLSAVAHASDHSILELAICWLLAQKDVSSVITGATSAAQVTANVAASQWQLDADELAAVDAVLNPKEN
jgi:aryl-alcohol dehydrogenase-like predicted oxidoreductase